MTRLSSHYAVLRSPDMALSHSGLRKVKLNDMVRELNDCTRLC